MRFNAATLRDGEQRVQKFIKSNGRLPNYLTLREMDKQSNEEIPLRQYCGLYFSDYTFWLKNGRHPNFTTLNITKSEPTIINYQDTYYTCCPTSLSMASTKLFRPVTEAQCATALGTTRNGTPPQNLINNAYKVGFNVNRIPRTPHAVQEALNVYDAVICHYQTGPADCSGFVNDYGHYCLIKSVSNGRYTVYDPTKGQYTCPTSVLDNATNGRELYYYRVSLR